MTVPSAMSNAANRSVAQHRPFRRMMVQADDIDDLVRGQRIRGQLTILNRGSDGGSSQKRSVAHRVRKRGLLIDPLPVPAAQRTGSMFHRLAGNRVNAPWVRFFCGEGWVAGGLGRGCEEGSVLLRSGLSKTWTDRRSPDVTVRG
jgi:hypothetical protein